MRRPALYGTLIIALSVLPLFFLEGVAGAFFPSIAVAYLAALVASMVVALTLTPALSLLLLSDESAERGKSPLVQRLQHGYEGVLSRVVSSPLPAFVAVGALVVAAAAAAPFLQQSLLPTFKETEVLVRWDGPPGTSLPEMNRITALASEELRSIEGVKNVGAHVGRAVTADQVVGVNSGEIWVSIDPAADYDATLASVEEVVAGYPGLSRDVQTFSEQRVREVLVGGRGRRRRPRLRRGPGDPRGKAEEVQRAVSGIDGLADERVRLPAEEPTLEIEVDLAAAQRHGIKPGDVRRAAATLLSGIAVGSLFEQQKVFDVVVWGAPETRSSLTDIRELLIDTPSGGHVRLGDVADVRIAPNPAVIRREGVSRYVDVAANVDGRSLGSAMRDVEGALATVAFPLEYHAEVLAADRQPVGRLIAIGVAAAIGILLLLQAAFGSWRVAALTFSTLPVAVAGGVLAAVAAGGTLSFGSVIGLLAVFGLAARNGGAADRSLPAPRATRGRSVRHRARAARRARAVSRGRSRPRWQQRSCSCRS